MADKRLSLIVELINDTKSKFDEITKDIQNVDAQSKKTTASLATFEPVFKSMMTAGTIAFAGISLAVVQSVNDAREAIKVEAQLNAVLNSTKGVAGMTADAVLKLSTEMSKMTNYSDEEVTAASNLMLTFTKIGSNIFPTAIKAAADMSAALGQDLHSSVIQLGKALQDPILGVAALRRVGVSFTKDQQDFIKSLVDSGKQLEAQKYILREINTEFGGSAEAIASSFTILKNQVGEVGESIGRALLPVIKQVVGYILPIVEKLRDWISANPQLTVTILAVAAGASLLVIALGALGLAMIAVKSGTGTLGLSFTGLSTVMNYLTTTTVSAFIVTLKTGVVNAFATARTAAIAFGAQMTIMNVLLSVGVVGALIFTVYQVAKCAEAFNALSADVGGAGNAIALTFLVMKQKGLEALKGLLNIFTALNGALMVIPGVSGLMKSAVTGLQTAIDNTSKEFDTLAATVYKPGEAAETTAQKTDKAMADILAGLQGMDEGATTATDAIKTRFDLLADAVKSVRDEITKTYDDIKSATTDYLGNVGDENKSYEQSVVDTVAGAQKKKLDLEVQLRQAQSAGDYSRIDDLGKQIKEQADIIVSYNSLQLNLDAQIDEERTRLSMNELQRVTFDHNKKLELMQIEYLEGQAKSLQKLLDLTIENNTILAMTDAQTKAKLEAEAKKGEASRTQLANEKAGLTTWIAESAAMYQSYATSVNSILSSIKSPTASSTVSSYYNPNANMFSTTPAVIGKRASGGPVSAGGTYLVGEKGPELFTPGEYGRIAANGSGGGLTIVITGNSFVGKEGIADEIGKSIMKQLKQNVKL
jgi:hypothetical protein